jgi:hypothetical protein
MQTFLPYADFRKSAECLDYRRLGKQRVEAKQLIDLLEGITDNNWKNHPAYRMWYGYVDALKDYYNVIVEEWVSRGYKNNMPLYDIPRGSGYELPDWFGKKDFHDAHKSNLLRKDYEYYKQFGWDVPLDLKYIWK